MGNTKIRLDDQTVLGTPTDGSWTGGLFSWSETGSPTDALDDINELLSSLAPRPAPSLDDIEDNGSAGVSGKLSFGTSNTIGGTYTAVGTTAGGSAVDVNGTFSISGDRRGIINATTSITVQLNKDKVASTQSPTPAYPQYAFGDANLGHLRLEVNGTVVHSIDLTNSSAINSSNGNGSNFNVIAATSVKFANNDNFDTFKYRTGTATIHYADMRNGWNYARVRHEVSSGVFRDTNYVEWVRDADTTQTSITGTETLTASMTGSRTLSGVQYHTGGSVLYTAGTSINNMYRNTYSSSGTAIDYNRMVNTNGRAATAYLNNPGGASLSNISASAWETTTRTVTNQAFTFQNVRLVSLASPYGVQAGEDVKAGLILSRTVANSPRTLTLTTSGATVGGFCLDLGTITASTDLVEYFDDEVYRLPSNADFTSTALTTGSWTSTNLIRDADSAGYNNGAQVGNGRLVYPSQNYTTLTNGPGSNANYSTGVTGPRYYYRLFTKTSATSSFNLNFAGIGTFIDEDTSFTNGSNQIKVSILLPSQTNWMDCTQPYESERWGTPTATYGGSGNAFNGGAPGCHVSGTVAMGNTWSITVGTKTTQNSGNKMYMRITVPQAWSGNIDTITVSGW